MQTASSDDDWRPGFAKRAPNFAEVCERAERWRWRPGETVARLAGAVLKGTPTLTLPQRLTLLLYVEHLNQDRLEQDIACVWPSSALIADYLGCSESTARAHRRALEAAGFMVRDYTRANRPAGVEAYDLAPLVARLDEMEAADAAIREAAQARRALYSEAVVFQRRNTARAPEDRRLEQSHQNESLSVREKRTRLRRERHLSVALRAPRTARPADPRPNARIADRTAPFALRREQADLAELVRRRRCARKWCARSFWPPSRSVHGSLPLVPATVLADPASADACRRRPDRRGGRRVVAGGRAQQRPFGCLGLAAARAAHHRHAGDRARGPIRPRPVQILRLDGHPRSRRGAGPAPELRPDHARPRARFRRRRRPPAALMDSARRRGSEMAGDRRRAAAHRPPGPLRELVRSDRLPRRHRRRAELVDTSGVAADRIKRDFVPAILEAAEVAEVFVDRVIITLRKDRR